MVNFSPYKTLCAHKGTIYILFLCIVVALLSTRGMTDENVIDLNGDMPRYLMNGVYIYDLVRDLPITDPLQHALRYFAKYPALSLGHHPLLPAIAEAPFFTIFGVSVFSGRLFILSFALLGIITWYLLIQSIYGSTIALMSSILLATNPYLSNFYVVVVSEIPALSLIILSVYIVHLYCETDEKKYAYMSAIVLGLNLYSRHTSLFILPVL